MKLSELYDIREALLSYRDFTSHNGDGDESGFVEEMYELDSKAIEAIDKEIKRLHAKNAMARVKRKLK